MFSLLMVAESNITHWFWPGPTVCLGSASQLSEDHNKGLTHHCPTRVPNRRMVEYLRGLVYYWV